MKIKVSDEVTRATQARLQGANNLGGPRAWIAGQDLFGDAAMDGAADDNNATSVDAIPFKKDLLLDMNIDIERGSSLSRPDQSLDPDDASDVWHCKHDGCMNTIYGASKEKNQRLIREHLDSHENVIKAVLGEQAMTQKPVG